MPNVERNRSWFSLLKLIAGAFMLFSVAGCGAAGFVVTGQLIDGDTGKPMPNAWVHQEWLVSDRFRIIPWAKYGTAGCADEQVTRTDAKGSFRFELPPKLRSSGISKSVSAYVTPLVPGYDIDRDKSKNQGESRQVVVAKKDAPGDGIPLTREQFVLSNLGFVSGGGRCARIGQPQTILNLQMSEEAAKKLRDAGVTLDELGRIYRQSTVKSWGYPMPMSQVETSLPYIAYRWQLERMQ